MPAWALSMLESLWLNAIIAIPLVISVVAVCKWTPCRPSTRRFLWLLVLMLLVIPGFSHPDKVTDLFSAAFPAQASPEHLDAMMHPASGSDRADAAVDSDRVVLASPSTTSLWGGSRPTIFDLEQVGPDPPYTAGPSWEAEYTKPRCVRLCWKSTTAIFRSICNRLRNKTRSPNRDEVPVPPRSFRRRCRVRACGAAIRPCP